LVITYNNCPNNIQKGYSKTSNSFSLDTIKDFFFTKVELLKIHEDELGEVGVLYKDFSLGICLGLL
jgi:hypothetical protein